VCARLTIRPPSDVETPTAKCVVPLARGPTEGPALSPSLSGIGDSTTCLHEAVPTHMPFEYPSYHLTTNAWLEPYPFRSLIPSRFPISHGCVRVSPALATMQPLYGWRQPFAYAGRADAARPTRRSRSGVPSRGTDTVCADHFWFERGGRPPGAARPPPHRYKPARLPTGIHGDPHSRNLSTASGPDRRHGTLSSSPPGPPGRTICSICPSGHSRTQPLSRVGVDDCSPRRLIDLVLRPSQWRAGRDSRFASAACRWLLHENPETERIERSCWASSTIERQRRDRGALRRKRRDGRYRASRQPLLPPCGR